VTQQTSIETGSSWSSEHDDFEGARRLPSKAILRTCSVRRILAKLTQTSSSIASNHESIPRAGKSESG